MPWSKAVSVCRSLWLGLCGLALVLALLDAFSGASSVGTFATGVATPRR